MGAPLYVVPDCIKGLCDQKKYSRWLHAKANTHVRRDRKRFGKGSCTVSNYKTAIHAAVCDSADHDHYTGEILDWHLVSTYNNASSAKGKMKYKSRYALLPTVDHTLDDDGKPKFVICSWRVNDAKSDLTKAEFYRLCELVLKHRDRPAKR
jgi:hypothetical protein